MQIHKLSIKFIKILSDYITILIAFVWAYFIVSKNISSLGSMDFFFLLSLIFISWGILSKNMNLYEEFRSRLFSSELVLTFKALFLLSIYTIIFVFFIKQQELSRIFIGYFSAIVTIMVISEKLVIRKILIVLRFRGRNKRNIVIIGAGEIGVEFSSYLLANPHFGYYLHGYLDEKQYESLNGEYLGSIADLKKIISERKIDDVVIALPSSAGAKINEVINVCERNTVRVMIIPDYSNYLSRKVSVSTFGEIPILGFHEDRLNAFHWRLLKRLFDLGFTFILSITLFIWLFPIIILFQKIFNPGPVFYSAKRWGRNGKEFICYKFRSMLPDSINTYSNGTHHHSSRNDRRITKFGKLLRVTNIDELPQFWNILKGDMTIVGPRPHDAMENIHLKNHIDEYDWRHTVKPGLTGWAQINGFRGGTSNLELMRKRIDYDLWYIENWSFWFDIQIIIVTIWKMFIGDKNAY